MKKREKRKKETRETVLCPHTADTVEHPLWAAAAPHSDRSARWAAALGTGRWSFTYTLLHHQNRRVSCPHHTCLASSVLHAWLLRRMCPCWAPHRLLNSCLLSARDRQRNTLPPPNCVPPKRRMGGGGREEKGKEKKRGENQEIETMRIPGRIAITRGCIGTPHTLHLHLYTWKE